MRRERVAWDMGIIVEPDHPARFGSTRFQRIKSRIMESLGRMCNALRMPGLIRDFEYKDTLTGQYIRIRVGVLFTRISINGRDYYFHRLSGRFDGTGMGCS